MSQDWLQGKSPKMWVNEICVKQLRQPKWETREAHPGQQPPTFICTCMISYSDKTLEAEGSGKTKKEAEQEAALEMLKTKLGMTPAKLKELNNSSNAKRRSVSSSLSTLSSPLQLSLSSASSGAGDEGVVSDTDDDEMNKAEMNPVSELMAICDQSEFEDPTYEEISSEGPPHKRIFTMMCTVSELGVSMSGRRFQKKLAKRLAAFRVLREVKKRGYQYSTQVEGGDSANDSVNGNYEETDGGESSKREIHLENGDGGLSKEDILRMENLSLGTKLFEEMISCGGRRMYCNSKSEKCVEYCVNYAHAFQHLKQSATLDKVLTMPNYDSLDQFGGPASALEQIAREVGIQLTLFYDTIVNGVTKERESVGMLQMKFPFKFQCKVPTTATVHSFGVSEADARRKAAIRAIDWLRSIFI